MDEQAPQTPPPDVLALRRRVLLAGALALTSYLVLGYVVTAANGPEWLVLPGVVLIWALIVRPLMAPVHAANRLRRQRAKQAFFDSRRAQDD